MIASTFTAHKFFSTVCERYPKKKKNWTFASHSHHNYKPQLLFPIRSTNNMIGLEPHFGVIWITGLFRPRSYCTVFTLFIRKRLLFTKAIIFLLFFILREARSGVNYGTNFQNFGSILKRVIFSLGILVWNFKDIFHCIFFPPLRGVV